MNNWNNQYGWNIPTSNIQYCTGLEEALSRCNTRNTENVFFHQDKLVFYRIKVDEYGKKYWQEFEYNVPKPAETEIPATRADLTDIVERIRRIEEYVFQDVEVTKNE
jgi:hypothetical protein